MALSLAFTIFAASINIISWVAVVGSMSGWGPITGAIVWGFIQIQEIAPILDELNLDASIAALVRITRAPHEVPNYNESVTLARFGSPRVSARFLRTVILSLPGRGCPPAAGSALANGK